MQGDMAMSYFVVSRCFYPDRFGALAVSGNVANAIQPAMGKNSPRSGARRRRPRLDLIGSTVVSNVPRDVRHFDLLQACALHQSLQLYLHGEYTIRRQIMIFQDGTGEKQIIKIRTLKILSVAALYAPYSAAAAATINIATVNNSDMIIMQQLSTQWEQQTGNKIRWIILEENILRNRLTTDIANHGGQFDIITIGTYETPIWAKLGWLTPLDDFPASYDYADLLPPVKSELSYDGKLYAAPFYAESSFTMYRKDLFAAAGLAMPDQPTYADIAQFADKLTDKSKKQYGICLRGKPGAGENMSYITTLVNTNGGAWFDMNWKPQLTSEPWVKSIAFYVDLMKKDGPPGADANGFNENEALFATGHCAMWIDATSAAGHLMDPKQSYVVADVGFTKAPIGITTHGAAWAWAWALAIPTSSHQTAAAKSFIAWATSKAYINLVGQNEGWAALPPGTRRSTYDNPQYQAAAPFAPSVLKAILSADPTHPTLNPVPYTGIQFAAIPQYQSIASTVGQDIAGALTGQTTVATALARAQASTTTTMSQAGYFKP